mmetsp:Transcript_79435/g.233435  ORF Transcript_79435/g.233435 Transcript_79435/m.233435 type:complete len:422 (+) Transcript_79435:69-1334(+)
MCREGVRPAQSVRRGRARRNSCREGLRPSHAEAAQRCSAHATGGPMGQHTGDQRSAICHPGHLLDLGGPAGQGGSARDREPHWLPFALPESGDRGSRLTPRLRTQCARGRQPQSCRDRLDMLLSPPSSPSATAHVYGRCEEEDAHNQADADARDQRDRAPDCLHGLYSLCLRKAVHPHRHRPMPLERRAVAELAVLVVAGGPDGAVLLEEDAVEIPCLYVLHVLDVHLHWPGTVPRGVVAQLPKPVVAGCPHVPAFLQEHRVVPPGCYALHSGHVRELDESEPASGGSVAELPLAVVARGVDCAVCLQQDRMLVTSGYCPRTSRTEHRARRQLAVGVACAQLARTIPASRVHSPIFLEEDGVPAPSSYALHVCDLHLHGRRAEGRRAVAQLPRPVVAGGVHGAVHPQEHRVVEPGHHAPHA